MTEPRLLLFARLFGLVLIGSGLVAIYRRRATASAEFEPTVRGAAPR